MTDEYECSGCGETFTSSYFRNVHEANCDERETIDCPEFPNRTGE